MDGILIDIVTVCETIVSQLFVNCLYSKDIMI